MSITGTTIYDEEVESKVDYEFSHRYNHTLHAYIDISGDLIAGTLLSQIMYWFSNDKNGKSKVRIYKDGFFWLAKGRNDWVEEIRISPKQYDNAIKKLKDKRFVETKLYKFNAVPTTHIRPIYKNINEEIRKWKDSIAKELSGFTQTVNPDSPKGENGISPNGKMDIDQTVKSITETTNNNYSTEEYNSKTTDKASTKVEVSYKALFRKNRGERKLPYDYTQSQFDDFIKNKISEIINRSFEGEQNSIEPICKIISYFYRKYHEIMGERHPIMSDAVYSSIVNDLLDPIDVIYESGLRIDVDSYETMIDRFFETEYGIKSGNYTDYRIGYFFSDTVIERLYYREFYSDRPICE